MAVATRIIKSFVQTANIGGIPFRSAWTTSHLVIRNARRLPEMATKLKPLRKRNGG